jgi:hypothetical protein
MTHKEVMDKWIGKNYAETPELWFQCVWYSKLYCSERGYPIKWFWGSAWKGWVTWSPFDSKWKRVLKTPMNYPKEWDIIFFDESRCKNGHVSVWNRFCTPLLLRYSDQNWTWKYDKIQHRWGTYKSCVWWFTRISK